MSRPALPPPAAQRFPVAANAAAAALTTTARGLGAPDAAVAGLLTGAATDLSRVAADPALASVTVGSVSLAPAAGSVGNDAFAQPLAMMQALTSALATAAATPGADPALPGAAIRASMVVSGHTAAVLVAQSLSATGSAGLASGSVLAGPAAVGAVGTPTALAVAATS